jgi:hypothetical protein
MMKPGWWALLLGLLLFTILRRSFTAAFKPSPTAVQIAVKQALLSIIMLDAAATLMVRGPYWALAIVVLLVPSIALGKWVYST